MNTEPAVIVSLVSAIITLAIAFGLPLSVEQVGAIIAVVQIAAGLVIRAKVVPVDTVEPIDSTIVDKSV